MAAKTLIILRHAKSDWDTGEPDMRRPLADRGLLDGAAAGEVLADYDLDVVLCSEATRARQTWERAVVGGASCDDVRHTDAIYGAWPSDVVDLLRELPDAAETVLVIGHEPTLSDLVLELAEQSDLTDRVAVKFPTAGLAVLEFVTPWSALDTGTGVLTRFVVPRG